MEPTYTANGGVLTVADGMDVGFRLRMLGGPGREVIRARSEGYGLRGQSPFEGHLVVRERPADPSAEGTFAAVLEPFQGEPRVASLVPLAQTPADPATVGMAVTVATPDGPRTDYVLSAVTPHEVSATTADGHRITFNGRFAVLATQGGKLRRRMVAGGAVAYDGDRLASPAPFRGRVERLDGSDRLVVAVAAGSAEPGEALAGRVVRVVNPAYVCPAAYTVTAVEPAGPGRVALRVNMPFTVAHGVVRSVDTEAGAFATATPVMKLRVNPGLFDGKVVRAPDGSDQRLSTAEEGAFRLAERRGIGAFRAGGEYTILDVGGGDEVEVLVPAM
ncbi:MAG: hypothetical protein HYU66_01955 [Armatimonadetes bacterium]|nr:hypothetical protein [Armatimonadota bacterium]